MTRINRRATTDGRPIADNRIFDIRVLSDGYGIRRSPAMYYRRNTSRGRYTGPVRNFITTTGK